MEGEGELDGRVKTSVVCVERDIFFRIWNIQSLNWKHGFLINLVSMNWDEPAATA